MYSLEVRNFSGFYNVLGPSKHIFLFIFISHTIGVKRNILRLCNLYYWTNFQCVPNLFIKPARIKKKVFFLRFWPKFGTPKISLSPWKTVSEIIRSQQMIGPIPVQAAFPMYWIGFASTIRDRANASPGHSIPEQTNFLYP